MNLKDMSNVTITQLITDLKTAGYTVQKLNPKKIAIEISHTTKKKYQEELLKSIAETYNGEYIPKVRGTNSDGVRVSKNDKESILIVLKLKRDAEHYEKEEVNSINNQLTEIKYKINENNKSGIYQNFVPLVFNNITYNVIKCVQTQKDENTGKSVKSDFHFIDENGKECLWISHKAGKTASSFQQWGGITEDGEPKINSKKEVKDFINEVKKLYPKNFPDGITLARKIKDNTIKKMAVYGHDYGSTNYGRQNVNYVLQGKIDIIPSGGMKYKLKANVMHSNGDNITGGYEPVLMVNYRKGRNNFQIKDARGSIYPIEGRKITKFI